MNLFPEIKNIREIRKNLGMNQMEFWQKIGVTQSGGSRYESGRNMPKPVRELLRLVHVEHVNLADVKGVDLQVVALLKEQQPELYRELMSEAKSRLKAAKKAKPKK